MIFTDEGVLCEGCEVKLTEYFGVRHQFCEDCWKKYLKKT